MGGLAILAVGRLPIAKQAQAVMSSTPFNIEWVTQFRIPGNFTLSGVRLAAQTLTRPWAGITGTLAQREGLSGHVPL